MHRTICLALLVGWLTSPLVATSRADDAASLLEALGQRAARLVAQLPPLPATREAWEQQRVELVRRLGTTLGLPPREPMKAAVTYSRQDRDLVIEEVAYLWAERAYVTATVIRSQKATGRQPAIVLPSGWLGHYTFRPYRQCVMQLARQGCVVLCIDDPRTGPRQAPYAGLYASAAATGLQVAGIQVFDALRGWDYLQTRADVDPGKIGIAGLGEGAIQAYLAAALEPRFAFLVAVGGTTTYEALIQSAGKESGPEDPSAFVAGLLNFTDLDRVAACLAPRPVLIAGSAKGSRWPSAGYRSAVNTLKTVYGLYGAEKQLHLVAGRATDDMTPYADEIGRWLQADVLATLKASDAAPAACGQPEQPDFSMLGYLQRRAAALATSDAAPRRDELVAAIRQACSVDGLKPAADTIVKTEEQDGLVTEQLALGVDAELRCPAVLVHPAAAGAAKHVAVVLSHDDRQCAASARVAEAARQLAAAGYWVLVPDHVSTDPQSRQTLANSESPSFYGDEAARFYGPADAVGLPPLALRVVEDLAAFRHLAARPEVDAGKITLAGVGLGGVDVCLAGLLEPRAAGIASLDATTLRDWIQTVAPGELRYYRIMPYLPSLLTKGDLDGCYAALAPRPLLVVRLKDGWPRSGFEQVAATTAAAYKLQQADAALLTLDARGVLERSEAGTPEGPQKQLLAVARTLVPTPPQAGLVGNLEGVKHRHTADSASGLIWVAAEMDGYDQQFTGRGMQLQTWSFFNGIAARKGFAITPLIFKKEGDQYLLTGIGKTRINTGEGLQTYAFESVAGSAAVGDDHFFGWHDGAFEGKSNAGVVEFEDAPDSRMVILAGDGQMGGQKLQPGAAYRAHSDYPRRYSIMAVSKPPSP